LIYSDTLPRVTIAALCKVVEAAAEGGDPLAQLLLGDAGTALGRLACAVIRKLELGAAAIEVSAVGGVFQNKLRIWHPFQEEVMRQYPPARVKLPLFSPLAGALLLAYRNGQAAITPDVLDQLQRSMAGRKK
jgi:N-acetylglucosamine kinase-like BadF-type ATPase